jgi:hypothetical protein
MKAPDVLARDPSSEVLVDFQPGGSSMFNLKEGAEVKTAPN